MCATVHAGQVLIHNVCLFQSDAVGVLPLLIPAIVARLEDPEDDVKGTAAAALLPVAQCMAEIVPAEVSMAQITMPGDAELHVGDANDKVVSYFLPCIFVSFSSVVLTLCHIRVCTYVSTLECLCACTSVQTVSVVQLLWNALVHLDDLSAATGSIMELLARLLAVSQQGTDGKYICMYVCMYVCMSVRMRCIRSMTCLLVWGCTVLAAVCVAVVSK